MKSVLWLCATVGAVSDASKCQADEATMLQGLNTVRLHSKKMPAKDTKSIFNNMRRVANSLVEGSDTPVSLDEVNDALDETAEALARMAPVFRQQLENAQQQIDDAISAFQGCQTTELRDDVGQYADAVESCTNTLDELRIAEAQQCDIAEDCLCDEARVRTTDHEALCASTTQTYEVAFCDHHAACSTLHQCHATEAEVYSRLRADVEAEMALLEEEYTIFEQVRCVTDLSREAITPPLSAIDPSASAACLDVDVSALNVNFPGLPQEPAACHSAFTHGNPPCGVGTNAVLIMKAVTDLFGYSSPYWENERTFNPRSAPEVEEDAKYSRFNDTPFNTIILCVGGPSSQCIRHVLRRTYSSARALFSAGPIEDDTIDQAMWHTAFEVGDSEDGRCPMIEPGFNVQCPSMSDDNAEAWTRFGWCQIWYQTSFTVRNCEFTGRADTAIGIGVEKRWSAKWGWTRSNMSPRARISDTAAGSGFMWGFPSNPAPRGPTMRPTWIYVLEA